MEEGLSVLMTGENVWTIAFYLVSGLACSKLCHKGSIKNRENALNASKWNRYYFGAFILLVLIATVRNSQVGTDMANFYVNYYESKSSFDFDWSRLWGFHQYEPGFQLWFLLLGRISKNYRWMYLCTYSLIAFTYVSFIKKFFKPEDGIIFMQIFFFYYTANMSGVRAAMGVAFVLMSFIAIDEEKNMKAVLLTLVGTMFHYTMMYNLYIIAFRYFLKNIIVFRKKFLWILGYVLSLAVSIAGLGFVEEILADTKYSYYFVDISEVSITGSLIYAVFAAACIWYYYQVMNSEKEAKTALQISMPFLLTYPILFLTGAYRIPYYYILPRLKVWSKLQKIFEERFTRESKKYIRLALQILVWMYLVYRYYKSASDGHFAYHIL